MDGDALTVYAGDALAAYGFGGGHPFNSARQGAYLAELRRRGLDRRVTMAAPVQAGQQEIEWFHTRAYVERVKALSARGRGFLDHGDTPAFPGVFEAAATVVGTTLAAIDRIMNGDTRRAFVPIAGLHHARRDAAAGFCVFNDCGVAIEALRLRYGVHHVAYVDIDAHHGDGVFYGFEDDPELIFADLHEDGRYLYPGTGGEQETGKGAARGTKLNLPLPPGADDAQFMALWETVEQHVDTARPDFILLQCGADSLAGDPITHLAFTESCHGHAARRLRALAERHCGGRLLAMGGGGYAPGNLARAWAAVTEALL